jgi:hypothetical protein
MNTSIYKSIRSTMFSHAISKADAFGCDRRRRRHRLHLVVYHPGSPQSHLKTTSSIKI